MEELEKRIEKLEHRNKVLTEALQCLVSDLWLNEAISPSDNDYIQGMIDEGEE